MNKKIKNKKFPSKNKNNRSKDTHSPIIVQNLIALPSSASMILMQDKSFSQLPLPIHSSPHHQTSDSGFFSFPFLIPSQGCYSITPSITCSVHFMPCPYLLLFLFVVKIFSTLFCSLNSLCSPFLLPFLYQTLFSPFLFGL